MRRLHLLMKSILAAFALIFVFIVQPAAAIDTFLPGDTIADDSIIDGTTGTNPLSVVDPTLTVTTAGDVSNTAGAAIDFDGIDFTLLNQGIIFGSTTGVTTSGDGTVNNEGDITGDADDGIFIGNEGTVTNNVDDSSILGADYGVRISDTGTVENNGARSTIIGTAVDGVRIGNGMVTNSGNESAITGGVNGVSIDIDGDVVNGGTDSTITGTANHGVLIGDDGTVTNSGLRSMITGGADGVHIVGGGTVDNTGDSASITGPAGDGVFIGGAGTVTNSGATSLISGVNGVVITGGGTVVNSGTSTITGTAGTGVTVTGGAATVTNSGTATITGTTWGIVTDLGTDFADKITVGSGSAVTSGSESAIATGGGIDTITIGGSVVSGSGLAIDAGAGDDTVNLEDGASVNGDIEGGGTTAEDTINLSGTGIFGSDFLNFSTLNMGSGDWTLNGGTHTVADTQITGGTLRLNGGSLSGTAALSGGTLTGDGGTIFGTLTVSGGTLAPGDDGIGTMTANGDFNMTGGTLAIQFTNTTNDVLTVGGTSDLSGGIVSFAPSVGNVLPAINDMITFTFINGNGFNIGGAEEFAGFSISPVFGVVLNYNVGTDGNVGVDITRLFTFASFANTPNRLAIAGIFDDILGAATGDAANLLAGLESQPGVEGLLAALDQLSPEPFASIPRIRFQEHRSFKKSLIQRLRALRYGNQYNKSPSRVGPQLALANLDPFFLGRILPGNHRYGSVANRSKWNPFVRTFGSQSVLNTKVDHFGFEASTFGLTVGLDKKLSGKLSLGAATGFAVTDADFDNVDTQASIKTVHLAVFGEFAANNWHVDGVLSYAYSAIEMDRRILFGDINRLAESDHSGNEFLMHVGTGYDFHAGEWILGPEASLE